VLQAVPREGIEEGGRVERTGSKRKSSGVAHQGPLEKRGGHVSSQPQHESNRPLACSSDMADPLFTELDLLYQAALLSGTRPFCDCLTLSD